MNIRRIILDTNVLMAIAEFKLDLISALEDTCDFHYELYVLQGTIDELNKIMDEQRLKYRQAAKLALAILKVKGIKIIPSEKESKNQKYVDDQLVDLSKKGDLVLTQDVQLKKRLNKPYLTIRQKKSVMIIT
ncbi:hypothetical protein COY27_05805 [Candidatus Woesearchaeota archaeon CG_4_10_14_0_2_um_filter_33_13]|nr:MAG: hypothetical protein COY27_05805 [Candidatus Woesearchaeota archaeon CG_4_10_14_0_2_um_filter_33_13]